MRKPEHASTEGIPGGIPPLYLRLYDSNTARLETQAPLLFAMLTANKSIRSWETGEKDLKARVDGPQGLIALLQTPGIPSAEIHAFGTLIATEIDQYPSPYEVRSAYARAAIAHQNTELQSLAVDELVKQAKQLRTILSQHRAASVLLSEGVANVLNPLEIDELEDEEEYITRVLQGVERYDRSLFELLAQPNSLLEFLETRPLPSVQTPPINS